MSSEHRDALVRMILGEGDDTIEKYGIEMAALTAKGWVAGAQKTVSDMPKVVEAYANAMDLLGDAEERVKELETELWRDTPTQSTKQ